jgi:DNA topoisomerase-3
MRLVIAEKPSVAMSIAAVIGANQRKNGYVEGNGYIVSWCVGHLVDLSLPQSYDEALSVWSIEQLPIIPEKYKHSVKAETVAQYKVLKELLNNDSVDEVVCATDAGREGELIFRRVYYKAGCSKPMKRLWISSMEDAAILEGMNNLKDSREYDNLYNSAMCRAKADWLIGINMTRLMTKVYDTSVLNVGRVISPTLAMICEREKQITSFVKHKYYRVHLKTPDLDAVSEKIDEEDQTKKVIQNCQGQPVIVKDVVKEDKSENPPLLYDLTSLQGDANSMFGYTAKHTLELAQSLYEAKLVTYPRTDAKYLTDDMEDTAREVIDIIYAVSSGLYPADSRQKADIKRILNSSKVSDHHAIIPTVQIKDQEKIKALSQEQLKLLALIVCRLLCAAGQKHLYASSKVVLSCAGADFSVSGRTVIDNGWKSFENALRMFYKADKDEEKDKEEVPVPNLEQNQEIMGASFNISEHYTAPPKRYTDKTLLRAMECAGNSEMSDDVERKGLGTSATRAETIETLIRQSFIERDKKNLFPTQKGINLIDVLPEKIASVELTVEWENRLLLISKGEDTEDAFMSDIESFCRQLVSENKIPIAGKENLFPKASGKETVGKCPGCGADVYAGKHGLYCSNKCGLGLSTVYAFGKELSQAQVKNLIEGKKVLVKDLVSKGKGTKYEAYAVPDGVEDYEYINKSGEKVGAKRFKFKMEFPVKKK